MRILVCAAGSYGDIFPFVGLGRALRLRGHEVLFLANPFFRDVVEAEGLELVPVGDVASFRANLEDPDLWDLKRGPALVLDAVMRHVPEAYETMRGLLRRGETVLVASTLAFPARLLQESHGVPLATVHLAPGLFRSARDPVHFPFASIPERAPGWLKRGLYWLTDRLMIDPLIAPKLNAYRSTLGLPPVRRIFHDWMHSPDLVIGMFPDRFAPPRDDWPAQTRLTGFPLYDAAAHEPMPAAVAAFLADGPPPVLFAPGTANTVAEDFFRASLAACERAGLRALLVTRYADQVPTPLPPWAMHAHYVPFSQALPGMHGFVHHGGIGTLSQGLHAGVPQIIRPVAFDQFDNAARARALGVAEVILPRHYEADTVAGALRRAAAPDRRQASADLANALAGTSDLSEAARLIEALGHG